MSEWRGIEELVLPKRRPGGRIPTLSARRLALMRDHGPLEPVVVRPLAPRRYEILANAQDWLAAQRLGRREVLIEVHDGIDDAEAAAIVAASYGDAGGDDALAEARGLAELVDAQGGARRRGAVRRAAAVAGLSRTYVSHALRLLRLPGAVQALLREGRIRVGHAKLLVGIGNAERQLALAEQIAAERLSVRAAEALVRAVRRGAPPPAAGAGPALDPDAARLERLLTEALGSRVRLDGERGRLVIDYGGNLDVLDGVLGRLGIRDF